MKTITEKLDYINKEINLTTNFNKHTKNAKEIKLKYYYLSRLELKKIDSKILLKHSFQSEVLSLAELLEKKEIINKIITTKKIKIEKMNEAAKVLLQYKDFESFSKVKTDVKTFNCTVMSAVWKLEGNQLIFYIKANRFLRNMVRAIVGTLLDVGLEKKSLDDFRNIIESKKRSEAGLSVPAKGLFLTEVNY